MPWLQPNSLPFTRLDVVASVPSESGVYGLMDGEVCVFVGESWNLKARLLELASVLTEVTHLTIIYELCPDEARFARKAALCAEYTPNAHADQVPPHTLPGISLQSRSAR